MNKQQSDREEFENGVGDEMFGHFLKPCQQNHKDEVWAWINAQIESKLKEMAIRQAVELTNLDQQITTLKAEVKQAKQEGAKEVLEEVENRPKERFISDEQYDKLEKFKTIQAYSGLCVNCGYDRTIGCWNSAFLEVGCTIKPDMVFCPKCDDFIKTEREKLSNLNNQSNE